MEVTPITPSFTLALPGWLADAGDHCARDIESGVDGRHP